jgi:hypothetical protein
MEAAMRRVILDIDGLPRKYEIAQIPENAGPAEIAVALHMAADTIALLDGFDELDEFDKLNED